MSVLSLCLEGGIFAVWFLCMGRRDWLVGLVCNVRAVDAQPLWRVNKVGSVTHVLCGVLEKSFIVSR